MSEGSVSGSVGVGTATVPAAEIPPDPSTGCRIRQTIAVARRSPPPDASAKEHIFTKDRGSCNNWIELLCKKVRLSARYDGKRAVYAASLEQKFAQSIPVDWEDPSLDVEIGRAHV